MKSCLDLAISSWEPHAVQVSSFAPLGTSDHLTITGHLMNPTQQPQQQQQQQPTSCRRRWKWSDDTIAALRQALSTSDLSPPEMTVADTDLLNTIWRRWCDTVIQVSHETCCRFIQRPQLNGRGGPPNPWVTPELIAQIKSKHSLYRAYLKTRTEATWLRFTAQRNRVTTLLRRAKSNFIESTTNTSHYNKQHLYKLVRCLKKSPVRPIPGLIVDNQDVQDSQEKATALNEFFINQSRQSVHNTPTVIPDIRIDPQPGPSLDKICTSPTEVETLLRALDTKKSAGYDGINTRVLKEAAAQLAPSLCQLFNLSFQHSILPQDWKDATISPLFKKGDPHLCNNYRPISLLSVVSKVCERIVHSRLYKHLERYLPPHQSGFRREDGTELQLARIIHEISASRDSGDAVMACFFDLSKAFDRVWHDGLIAKLEHCNVAGTVLSWLRAYLTGRRQRVAVEGTTSDWLLIPAGVPQGSVLGPLLFLAYTIDLPTACTNNNTTCSQFADDTALIASNKSYNTTHQQLQLSVTSAGEWLSTWHLLVNTDKTVVMVFHHSNRPPPFQPHIILHGRTLNVVTQQRHLGVIIQSDLRWNAHFDSTISKATKSLHILRRLRHNITTNALCALYTVYIRPILEYACIALTPLSNMITDCLERFQRRAARLCLRLPLFKPTNHSALLHRLSLPTLSSRRQLRHTQFAHKIHHQLAPSHIRNLALLTVTHSPYSLRHSRSYHIKTSRTDRHKESPVNIALHHFNSLPSTLREIGDHTSFKEASSNLLLNSICSCSAHPTTTF